MRPTFDIEALRTIVVATELGSFARAAVQLGRSQSAVSMQLKRLEEQADCSLFQRRGRSLLPTEAGEALLTYARRIVAMHDEAGQALGAAPDMLPSIRLGLPQDFFEDVMPDALATFAQLRPNVHVEVRAGRNFILEEDVIAGRLDVALAFAQPDRKTAGELLALMPLFWLGHRDTPLPSQRGHFPLVLFNHPCLFRQAALQSLDAHGMSWRLALTTPSLASVWGALRFGLGATVRTAHGLPQDLCRIDEGLPALPALELRMLTVEEPPAAVADFVAVLRSSFIKHVR